MKHPNPGSAATGRPRGLGALDEPHRCAHALPSVKHPHLCFPVYLQLVLVRGRKELESGSFLK